MTTARVDFIKYAALGLLATAATPAQAQVGTETTSYTMFGTPGLILMPTAEVAADSELAFSYSQFGPNSNGALTFQILPRLSGTFRYTKLDSFWASGPLRGQDFYDRSFDLQYRILNESEYLPAISVGLRDFIGTGIYASEYVVATKSFGDKLRVHGGLGWGRLASHNPIGSIGGSRPPWDAGQGGNLNISQWFRGDFAPFGGLSYKVNDKLTFKAEYSSDAFVQETRRGTMEYNSPFNFGIDYQITPSAHFNASYIAGSMFGAGLTFTMNPRKPPVYSGSEKAPLPVKPRPSRADSAAWSTDWVSTPEDRAGIQKVVADALGKEGIRLKALTLSATRAQVKIENKRFNSPAQAVGRTVRILTHGTPPSVETFDVTVTENGIPLSTVTIRRSDIERLEHAPANDIYDRVTIAEAAPVAVKNAELPNYDTRFTWALAPYLTLSLFDPSSPIRGDVGLRLSGKYELAPNFILSGALQKSAWGDLGDASTTNSSVLPHVRTDGALYAQEGDPAIEHLTASWYERPGKNLYSRVTVGYLEQMFGGVSAELLWKPVDSRLAIGAEVAWVKQRDYDQLFGFQDYDVVTGHLSAYYDFGNGFSTRVDAGRYLAGDYGATVSVDRKFANGWKVGGYFTKTNVSAEDFGEGSFDKGIRISIPLEWALGSPSKSESAAELRSLDRDGGARLQVDGRLFDWVDEGHADAYAGRWGRFWR